MGLWGKKDSGSTEEYKDVLPSYMTGTLPAMVAEGGVSLSKAAQVSLSKFPKLKRPFALYKGSDISFSMDGFIGDGSLDYLTEGILTAAYEGGWDADNKVPAFPYGRNVAKKPHIIQLGQHAGSGHAIVAHAGRHVDRGGTNFEPPVTAIMDHYRSSPDWDVNPAIAFIQTDGINTDMSALVKALTNYSRFPIHWVFVYFGPVDMHTPGINKRDNAANLRKLDDGSIMPGRKVDNVSVFIAGPQPKRVTATELMEGLMTGPNQWVTDAQACGIL